MKLKSLYIFVFCVLVLSLGSLALASTFSSGDYNDPAPSSNTPSTPKYNSSQPSGLLNQNGAAPFSPGSNNVSLSVGQVFLTGDLSNAYENSLGTELNYSYGVSDLFAFQGSFGYNSHSNTSNNDNFSLMYLSSGVRTNLVYYDQLIPYAAFGLGFYRPSVTQGNSNYSGILFGLNFGAGVDLVLTRNLFFGTELTYHDMFNSTQTSSNGSTQSIGGAFISFLVKAGLSF